MPFGAFMDTPENLSLRMMPISTINATVVPVQLNYKRGGRYVLPPGVPTSSLTPKEKAMMTFSRIDDDDFGDFDTFLQYNVTEGPSQFLVVPGTYEVQGYIMLYGDEVVRIPKVDKTIDIPFDTDDVHIEINGTSFDTWTVGGIVFNNATGYVEITPEDLQNNQAIRFKVLRFPLPVTYSTELMPGASVEQVGQYEEYTNLYRHELQPEWIR